LNLRIKPKKRLVREKPEALMVPTAINLSDASCATSSDHASCSEHVDQARESVVIASLLSASGLINPDRAATIVRPLLSGEILATSPSGGSTMRHASQAQSVSDAASISAGARFMLRVWMGPAT
jgi:hypothetical protein